MPTAVRMPQYGITMTEGKITRWVKQEGDAIQKGDILAEIETDKLNQEVEATGEGVLRRIVAPVGAVLPVRGLMAVIAAAGDPDAAVEALLSGPPAGAAAAGTVSPLPLGEGQGE